MNIDGANIDSSPIGANTASTGAFTSLSATGTSTITTADINGGAIDGTTIGSSSASTGAFTTLSTTGVLTQDGGAVFNEASADVDFRVESNGNANMLFVDGGNDRLGIGTSSPSAELTVAGDITLGDTSGATITMNDTDGSEQDFAFVLGANALAMRKTSNSNDIMRLDLTNERVGIGTTSPAATLHINTSTNSPMIVESTHGDGGYIELQLSDSGGAGSLTGYIGDSQAIVASGTAADLAIRAQANFVVSTGGSTERMRIDSSSGNVGIGTSSPSSILHCEKALSSDTQSTPETILTLAAKYTSTGVDGAAGSGARLLFKIPDDSTNPQVGASIDGVKENGDDGISSTALVFSTSQNDATLDEAMRIDSSGRLLVGATSGSQKMLVSDNQNGNIAFKVQNSGNSTPYGQIIEFSGAAPDDNTRYFLRCGDTGANRMHIYSDGDVNTSDAGTLTSDRSLKTDIEDATSKLADINQLQVRNFKWITDYHPNKQNKHIGFIADEFETVFPSLVVEHENPIVGQDGTVKSVRYGALIPILVKALQEADDKIDALTARVQALESS